MNKEERIIGTVEKAKTPRPPIELPVDEGKRMDVEDDHLVNYHCKLKKNTVLARPVKGIYKDKLIEIQIGETGCKSKILINGKDVSERCLGVYIKIKPGELTRVFLEFMK